MTEYTSTQHPHQQETTTMITTWNTGLTRRLRQAAAAVLITCAVAPLQPALAATPDLQQMQAFLTLMDQYYELIESMHDVASSPERTAILQMQKIREIYEERGEKAAAADVLADIRSRATDPTVRNAATLMLVDVLKDTGRREQAVQVLRESLDEQLR